jgi:hypothetical protein
MTRLPIIGAVAAGLLIGVLPPAMASAASTTADSAPIKSGKTIFVSMMQSMSEVAHATETVDELR